MWRLIPIEVSPPRSIPWPPPACRHVRRRRGLHAGAYERRRRRRRGAVRPRRSRNGCAAAPAPRCRHGCLRRRLVPSLRPPTRRQGGCAAAPLCARVLLSAGTCACHFCAAAAPRRCFTGVRRGCANAEAPRTAVRNADGVVDASNARQAHDSAREESLYNFWRGKRTTRHERKVYIIFLGGGAPPGRGGEPSARASKNL